MFLVFDKFFVYFWWLLCILLWVVVDKFFVFGLCRFLIFFGIVVVWVWSVFWGVDGCLGGVVCCGGFCGIVVGFLLFCFVFGVLVVCVFCVVFCG